MSAYRTDAVVIGGGVVGLAIARQLAQAGHETIVLERHAGIGRETSSRNSGVLHAGVYYQPGSLKAQFCAPGRAMLARYCADTGVEARFCGKLLLASNEDEAAALPALLTRAKANGVRDIALLEAAAARRLEPEIACVAALWCRDTSIVDAHGLMQALAGDLTAAGGAVALATEAAAIARDGDSLRLLTKEAGGAETELVAPIVINAAGHGAPALARRTAGLEARSQPRQWFAKGNYFAFTGHNPFSRLIYPTGAAATGVAAGLGVHATLDLGGQLRFGPDVEWTQSADDVLVDPARATLFEAAVRAWWPGLPDGALAPAWAGVRPKLHGPGAAAPDFRLDGPAQHGVGGLVNLFGVESPGLTACLAIAARVAAMANS
ncbi:hypothetical protein GCM10019059_28410 [Camelimonas fluminis]|uniref:NAD(P)/FAD-dependent oxidoreductase n=1 Tax=Camelimonas fluminis TaxID=1576911 RepID=A0ABV7UFT7_9HYPH|nr:FAD-dependent oxidoreductase [Camelimonas fluminis]GHE66998.1 hypothetical protein GCM10019059_28410 [Camelimonas fluminis]